MCVLQAAGLAPVVREALLENTPIRQSLTVPWLPDGDLEHEAKNSMTLHVISYAIAWVYS